MSSNQIRPREISLAFVRNFDYSPLISENFCEETEEHVETFDISNSPQASSSLIFVTVANVTIGVMLFST